MDKRSFFLLAATSIMAVSSAQAATYSIDQSSSQSSMSSSQDKMMSNDSNNAAMVKQIQDNLKTSYSNFNVNVRINNGKVFLTGTVNSEADKSAIETDVKNMNGVTSVVNDLKVRNNATPSPRS